MEEPTEATEVQEEFEEVEAFREIDSMQDHGINMGDINKLKAAGLCTVLSVLMW